MKWFPRVVGHPLVYWPVAILLLLLVVRSLDPAAISQRLSSTSVMLLISAGAINVSALPVWALRTQRLLASFGYRIPLKDLLALASFANIANQVFPAGTGELGRGGFLMKLHQIPGTTVAAVLLFERGAGFALMLASSGAAIALLVAGSDAFLLVLTGTIAGVVGVIATGVRGARHSSVSNGGRIRRTIWHMYDIAGNPRAVIEFSLLSLLVYLILALAFLLSTAALGPELDLTSSWAIHGGGMVVGTLSALPFGLGAADLTVTSLMELLGFDSATAALAAVSMRLSLTLPLGLLGAVSYGVLSKRLADGLTSVERER